MRLRREVQEWFNEALAGSDAVIFPAASLTEPETEADAGPQDWLATALIAGAPVVAFGGGGGLPAFCLTGRAGAENPLLKLAAALRETAAPSGGS
jgi:glycosyltransferase involved in cell wall biosynthesis